MKNWSVNSTLSEIKNTIDFQLNQTNKENASILKEMIRITKEEYMTLCRQFCKIDAEEKFEKYCVCIVVAWVESYRYHNEMKFKENLQEKYAKIPQHAQGKFFRTYQNVFYDYGLQTFDIPFTSLKNVEKVIQKHAKSVSSLNENTNPPAMLGRME
jgi:hypothetical protein